MWQDKFIEISMILQSNANGGLFRSLSNVNEMFNIMFWSWLINIYLILLPIFIFTPLFLLFRSIQRFIFFPKFRIILPFLVVLCIACGTVVFVQLSEIDEDVSKIQKSSDYYTNQIIHHISLSINNTKLSFIKALKKKKFELFPLVDKVITDVIKIANRSINDNLKVSKFSFELFGKSDTVLDVLKRADLYTNSTYEMRKALVKLSRKCNVNLFKIRLLCYLYKKECQEFIDELKNMEHFFRVRDSVNKRFIITFGKIVPLVKEVAKSFNVSEFLITPVQFYDKGVNRMDEMLDKIINKQMDEVLSKVLHKNRPFISKSLQKFQSYTKYFLCSIVILNVIFIILVLFSVTLNYLVKPNAKELYPIIWSSIHFATYFLGVTMLVIFVVSTSVLLNSQTEVCRYLADISQSSKIADRFIDSFLDHQGKFILSKNIPEKILSIPKLNIKNPKGILTTVIRQCPAKRILLPSLKLYRPINTTAIIFSDFFREDILNPGLTKANETIYEYFEDILKISNKIFDAKDHLLELLNYFPQIGEKSNFSFEKLYRSIVSLNYRKNKVFEDNINQRLTFESVKFDECFDFISNSTIFQDNESVLFDLVEDMKYFESLIKELVVILNNMKESINREGEKYFTNFLQSVVEPVKIYANRLITILEDDTLSRVIPCNELSNFYLETVNGLCTSQLGNFLVLMIFETLTFTTISAILLVIMISY